MKIVLTRMIIGPTTDYNSTMVQWLRHRKRGRTRMEQERPSASYIVDVGSRILISPVFS